MHSKSVIFVVISVLVVILVYSSFTPFIVLAEPPASGWGSSKDCGLDKATGEVECCWREKIPGQILGVEYCQTCKRTANGWNCTPKEKQSVTPTTDEDIVPGDTGVLEQPPTSTPFDPGAPLQGGVLEQQEQQTPPTFAPGNSPGVLEQLEQGGGLQHGFFEQQQEQPPGDQGATELPPPTTEDEPPVSVCQEGLEFNKDLGFCIPTECPEGQELNEETGICVLEEQPAAADQPEDQEQQTKDEQSSEESGSEEENGNN